MWSPLNWSADDFRRLATESRIVACEISLCDQRDQLLA